MTVDRNQRPRGPIREGNAQAINITKVTKGELDASLLVVQALLKERVTMDDIVHAALNLSADRDIALAIRDERARKKSRGKPR